MSDYPTRYGGKGRSGTSMMITPQVRALLDAIKARYGWSYGDQVCWLASFGGAALQRAAKDSTAAIAGTEEGAPDIGSPETPPR